MTRACHTLRLVLGDQLNPGHSWFAQVDPQVVYVLMEVRQETDYVLHHAQKILAIFATMRDFARQLREAGHRVRYVALDDASNRQSIPDNLAALAAHYGAQAVQWQQPDEWRLDAQLQDCAATALQPLACKAVDSEHFLTARGDLAALMHGRRQWLMEHFYRHMRRRHQVLLDAHGQPEGGQWNFDHDNRKPWPGTPPEPADWRPQHDHSGLWAMIKRAGVASFGAPQADALRWPLNRGEALACLDAFITTALPHFGDYEDALAAQAPRLFHSLLSFALNVKMLHPLEVVQRAESAWRGPGPVGRGRGLRPSNFGLARIRARHLLGAHAGLRRAQRAGPPPAAAALVLERRHTHALPAPGHHPVAADSARAPYPAADGDWQFRAARRAGAAGAAPLVPGHLHRRL